jgi:hypothetical protein
MQAAKAPFFKKNRARLCHAKKVCVGSKDAQKTPLLNWLWFLVCVNGKRKDGKAEAKRYESEKNADISFLGILLGRSELRLKGPSLERRGPV